MVQHNGCTNNTGQSALVKLTANVGYEKLPCLDN